MLLHVAVGILVIWAKNAANWRSHYWAIESFSFKLATLSCQKLYPSVCLSFRHFDCLSIHQRICTSVPPSLQSWQIRSLVCNVKVLNLNSAPASILVTCWNSKCQLLNRKLATSLWQMSVCLSVCPSICIHPILCPFNHPPITSKSVSILQKQTRPDPRLPQFCAGGQGP